MIGDAVIQISDPTWAPPEKPGLLKKLFGRFIRDERDLPFIRLSLFLTLVFGSAAVLLFVPGNFRWWMAPIYWALYIWFLGPFILMLHNTCHRKLFKREYRYFNQYIPWALGIFLGQPPESYFVHHIGMHHADGNLPDDLSSTMPYQRDSLVDLLKYVGSFVVVGAPELFFYMNRRGRKRLAGRLVSGELSFLVLTVLALLWNWRAALVVFVIPLLATRVLLMMGNWAQHAFVDPDEPTNDYRTVVTFINSFYNHRCFNDGYHLGHHLKPDRHWLDMPADFLEKRQEMIENQSLVFRKIDYFVILLLLIFKRHRKLASYFVNLDPENPLSEDEVVALIKRRVKKFDVPELEAIGAATRSAAPAAT
jgi:fatty acid desaturase